MQDNFDLYEYKNTLREQSLNGVDASTKVLEFLRSKIYPKLNDDEMDTFVVEMANHFDMTPPSYRLKEDSQQTISLDDLTFDILVQSFGEKPMFGFNVPNANDSSNSIHDQDGLDRWSNSIRNKYGNVNIRIDSESSSPWEKIQIIDDQFIKDKEDYSDSKGRYLDSERKAGRTDGLD
tara:strand:- start:353 stop:886 length:534 start_codon:yes stop_codon:yes gene_type:complete